MRWSIRAKIITLTLTLVLIATVAVTWVSIRQLTQQVEASLEQAGQNLLASFDESIRRDMEQAERLADLFSTHHELLQLIKAGQTAALEKWLNQQSEIEIYALLEIFDAHLQPLAVNRWLNKKPEEVAPYLTPPSDHALHLAQNQLKITAELKALPVGLTMKVVMPIVDLVTTEVLGVFVVSFPMNNDWLDRTRGKSIDHLTIQANESETLVSTMITPSGSRLESWPPAFHLGLQGTNGHIDHLTLFEHSYMVLFNTINDLRSIPQGYVVAWMTRDLIEETVRQILKTLLFVAAAVLGGCILLGMLVSRTMTRPLASLVQSVSLIAKGNLEHTVNVNSHDEIGDLAQAVGTMQNDLKTAHELREQILHAFQLFVPDQFLSFLEKESILDVKLGDQVEKQMTILFSDIRGFTGLSEKMTPQENFNFINSYLRRMEPMIRQYHGFIDKYIGDAIMALFPTNPDDAVRAAIAMLRELTAYNTERETQGEAPIQIGIGLNTGLLMLGIVGGENRMDGTVISDAVNLASRIEGMTKRYGVSLLISEYVFNNLKNPTAYLVRLVDCARVKGKKEPVAIFEIFDGDPLQRQALKKSLLRIYEEGVSLYYNRQFALAKECFQHCLAVFPEDQIAQIYLERCDYFLTHGDPPEGWDGVMVLDSK